MLKESQVKDFTSQRAMRDARGRLLSFEEVARHKAVVDLADYVLKQSKLLFVLVSCCTIELKEEELPEEIKAALKKVEAFTKTNEMYNIASFDYLLEETVLELLNSYQTFYRTGRNTEEEQEAREAMVRQSLKYSELQSIIDDTIATYPLVYRSYRDSLSSLVK